MRAFVMPVTVFCAFALLAIINGPAIVEADCAHDLCAHPCSVSKTACQNCHRIDVPAQCGPGGVGGSGGGGNKESTVLIYGDNNAVLSHQRMKRDKVSSPDAQLMMSDAVADAVTSKLLRAKRGWAADIKTQIKNDKKQQHANIDIYGNNNDANINQN